MGRHTTVSSPLRAPAVVVGVPVATVLATMGSNALLGGVVPLAEEMPLRAESAPSTPVSPVVPMAPDVLLGPLEWPSSWSPTAAGGTDATSSEGADAGPDQDAGDGDAATGTIRVVHVGAEQTPSTLAPRADDTGVASREPTDSTERERTGARDEADERTTPVADAPSATAEDSPTAASRSGAALDGEERVSAPGTSSEDEGSLVDLDPPAGGLSVLSFG